MHRALHLGSSLIFALGLWLPTTLVSAADLKSCAIVPTSIVTKVLAQPAIVYALPGAPSGIEACDVVAENTDDYTIVRENGQFAVGTPVTPGALALNFFPQLSDDTVAQINTATQADTITPPGFVINTLDGLGDSAVVVKTVPATMVSIVVRRGSDAFMLQTDDLGDSSTRSLTSLAKAVVPSPQPPVSVAGV